MSLPVWQAAAAVHWLEGRVENLPKQGEISAAKAALTYGDCVSQEILLTALRAHFPWVEIEAEEDTPTAVRFAENRSAQRVLIDPIDGTLRYVQRDGLYAILLGLQAEDGMQAALVGLPQLDTVIRSIRGGRVEAAVAGGEFSPLTAGGTRGGRPGVLVSHELPSGLWQKLEAEGFEVRKACGGAIGVAPLLPGVVGAIRTTSSSAGLSVRTWISTLATRELGGCVLTHQGVLPKLYRGGISAIVVGRSRPDADRLMKLLEEA